MLYVALLSLSVFQYYYSVRIFPGQEPASVWVGWVTSDFHQYDPAFELSKVRTVTVTLGDEKGKVHERSVMLLQEHSVILSAMTQLQTQRANETLLEITEIELKQSNGCLYSNSNSF